MKTVCFSLAVSQITPMGYPFCLRYRTLGATLTALVFSIGVAFGQQGEGRSIKLGETDLYPSVRVDVLQNSNAFLTESEPTSTTAFQIRPDANWIADRRLLQLQAKYAGDYQVSSEDVLNYNDHQLSGSVDATFSKRSRAAARLSVTLGHEDFGVNLTRGEDASEGEQVEFVDTRASASFTYGAARARGNIIAGLNIGQFDYSNRRDVTEGRDFQSFEPYGIFSLRISGDTRATFELRYRMFDSSPIRDRNDLSVLAGLQFAATGKSGGNIAIGTVQSEFDADEVEDSSNFIVEGNLFWEPSVFSRLSLELYRQLDGIEGGLASTDSPSVVRDRATLRWDYSWSERLSHVATLGLSAEEADCPSRDSQTGSVEIEVDLQIRRWLSVGLSAAASSREVEDCSVDTDPNLDFEKNALGLYMRATL